MPGLLAYKLVGYKKEGYIYKGINNSFKTLVNLTKFATESIRHSGFKLLISKKKK